MYRASTAVGDCLVTFAENVCGQCTTMLQSLGEKGKKLGVRGAPHTQFFP